MTIISNLARSYRKGFRLGPISLTLPEAGVVALIGRNGAGKTTFMNAVASELSDVALVPQSASLPRMVRVAELLEYLALLSGVPRTSRSSAVSSALTSVNMTDFAKTACGRLSGGQQRRVVIAQALLGEPSLVLMDEPSTGLDIEQRSSLQDVVNGLAQTRCVMVSTHVVEDVEDIADRVLVIEEGQMLFYGSTDEFLTLPPEKPTWRASYLGRIT